MSIHGLLPNGSRSHLFFIRLPSIEGRNIDPFTNHKFYVLEESSGLNFLQGLTF